MPRGAPPSAEDLDRLLREITPAFPAPYVQAVFGPEAAPATGRKPARKRARVKVAPKYRDPDNRRNKLPYSGKRHAFKAAALPLR